MYSINCQNCTENDIAVIVNPGSNIEDLNAQICKNCKNRPSDETLNLYLQIKSEVEENLDRTDLKQGEPEKYFRYTLHSQP